MHAVAVLAALGASAAWAWGSVRLRAVRPAPPLLAAVGWQLVWGGLALVLVGSACGEWSRIEPAALFGRPLAALLYLTFASCALGFLCYAWLVRHAGPALAGSWAFVNPIVALWTGHALLGEPLGRGVWAGSALVLAAAVAARREAAPGGL
ncbi:MAG: hypothetical protein D6776_02145 [Planctomycetota bacterium]|nr:MAG: hypothetical protein D6776_02145 [Planctomycetota bacterium]